MKGGNVNDFLERTGYEEAAVLYQGQKYFFRGLIYQPNQNLYTYEIHLWDSNNEYVKTIYHAESGTEQGCMDKFLQEPILDGKGFWELEREMTWVEW